MWDIYPRMSVPSSSSLVPSTMEQLAVLWGTKVCGLNHCWTWERVLLKSKDSAGRTALRKWHRVLTVSSNVHIRMKMLCQNRKDLSTTPSYFRLTSRRPPFWQWPRYYSTRFVIFIRVLLRKKPTLRLSHKSLVPNLNNEL